MFELGAEEWQLDFPVLYGSAKNNWMSDDWQKQTDSVEPLLDAVVEHIPAPNVSEGTTQLLITSLDYSSFTGRIAIGRFICKAFSLPIPVKLSNLLRFAFLKLPLKTKGN
jgi:GTP-binding protein